MGVKKQTDGCPASSSVRKDRSAGKKKRGRMSAAAFSEAVDDYFKSISTERTATVRVPSGEVDRQGKAIMQEIPAVNRLGKELRIVEYLVVPSFSGLFEHLGVPPEKRAAYSDPRRHPEAAAGLEDAKRRIREWNENELLTRSGSNLRGIIYNLENNFGYGCDGGESEGIEELIRRTKGEDGSDEF